jgi:hypothetical protein
MTIIARPYALKLIRSGKARSDGLVYEPDRHTGEPRYVTVTRHDLQRTDHYAATAADVRRMAE